MYGVCRKPPMKQAQTMGLVMINGAVMSPKAAVSRALRAYGKGGQAK